MNPSTRKTEDVKDLQHVDASKCHLVLVQVQGTSTVPEFPLDTTVAQWPSVDARLSDVGTSEIEQTKQGGVLVDHTGVCCS